MIEVQNEQRIKNAVFYKTFAILTNVIFVPIFLIILISTLLIFSARTNNEVPTLFGYSAMEVISESMVPTLNKEDIVLVKVIDPMKLVKNYDEGGLREIIAFYEYTGEFNEETADTDISGVPDDNYSTSIGSYLGGGTDKKVENYSKVVIHRIVAYKIQKNPNDPNYGKIFFQTKGDNNTETDGNWVMEDYVVGVFHSKNSFVANVFRFCSSRVGIICMIIVPSAFLVLMLFIGVSGQYKQMKLDKKLNEEKQLEEHRNREKQEFEANRRAVMLENTLIKSLKNNKINNKYNLSQENINKDDNDVGNKKSQTYHNSRTNGGKIPPKPNVLPQNTGTIPKTPNTVQPKPIIVPPKPKVIPPKK